MSAEKLQKFYYELAQRLLLEFYFYIPEGEISKQIVEKFEFLKEYNVLDKIYVLDNKNGIIEYFSERNNLQILQKGAFIEQNIYKLLKRKSKVTEPQFEYILEEYSNFFDSLFFVAKWMHENIHLLTFTDDNIKGVFHWQFLHFKKHHDSLRKAFPKTHNEAIEIKVSSEDLLERHFKRISDQLKTYNTPPTHSLLDATTPNTPRKISKKPLITEDEAETELLKKYFNFDSNS